MKPRKKASKALERWPPDPGPSPGSLKIGKPRKRLQKLAPRKAGREGTSQGDSNVFQRWLQREKHGSEATPALGLGKPRENQNQGKSERKS